MNNQTIERVEKKYLISKSEKAQILKDLSCHLEKDVYFSSTIFNLYLDTKNDDLIITSNDHPVFKQKFRLRSYNCPNLKTTVFLETKTKLSTSGEKIGNKRRLALLLEEFYKFQNHQTTLGELFENSDLKNQEIARELDYYFEFYRLIPRIFIAYDRESYVEKTCQQKSSSSSDLATSPAFSASSGFRLTFDENLRFRKTDLNLEKGDFGTPYFKSGVPPKAPSKALSKSSSKTQSEAPSKTKSSSESSPRVPPEDRNIIMEVKTQNSMPLWFVYELSRLKIYPSPFSKYGKIFNIN